MSVEPIPLDGICFLAPFESSAADMMQSAIQRKGLPVLESDNRLNGERRLRDSNEHGERQIWVSAGIYLEVPRHTFQSIESKEPHPISFVVPFLPLAARWHTNAGMVSQSSGPK